MRDCRCEGRDRSAFCVVTALLVLGWGGSAGAETPASEVPATRASWRVARASSFFSLGLAVALGACGSNSAAPGGSGRRRDDAESGASDGAAGDDAIGGGQKGGGTLDSAAGDDGNGSDSAGGNPEAGGDAAFEFDGFSHPDGYGEASYCPDDDGDGWSTCAGDWGTAVAAARSRPSRRRAPTR